MKKNVIIQDYHRCVEYYFDSGFAPIVSVTQHVDVNTRKWQDAEVNWSSIGSTSPECASEFSIALNEAIKTASLWTSDLSGKMKGN